mgnify:CR=1 FL=1
MKVYARCTCGPRQPFLPTSIERRDPGPLDVVIDIAYAGICHSDIEHASVSYTHLTLPTKRIV